MRRKIWEDSDVQCSIIGTCLSLKELQKIARQTNLQLAADAGEFDVHVTFVRLCSKYGPVAKAVSKFLDRKYAGAIHRFSKVSEDTALLGLWREAQAIGDIPGPYWALMTHPAASHALRRTVFGDVHMLSHLVGASNRADIRRLGELEQSLETVQQRHAKVRSIYRTRFKGLVRENRSLARRLGEQAKEAETLRSRAKDHCTEVVHLENQGLRRSLATQSVLLAEEQARGDALARKLEAFERRLEHLQEQYQDELREKQAEIDFLEKELQGLLENAQQPCSEAACAGRCAGGCEDAGTEDCPGPALCGKRILYVGGRANLVPHYRNVVERRGGEFLHHDGGGVEHARHALPRLLHGVDAVLCPVDCVSHDACQCVKEVCKHTMKPCKMLRSSGLSSLVRSLEELSAQAGTQRRS